MWLSRAAGTGNSEAQTTLGVLYAQGKEIGRDLAQAEGLLRQAAEAGYAPAP